MAGSFILAIDQGTTGTTVAVVDFSDPAQSRVIGRKTVDFQQHYPQPGWVEHDLDQIWESVCSAVKGALEQAAGSSKEFRLGSLAGIGITNQRETLCTFDRVSGKPLARAIVWQCRRSTQICADMKQQGLEAEFKNKTGLVLDPYFSGTKMTWLLRNNSHVAAEVRSGRAVFGTIDCWLVHRLTGGKSFVTEASNASRTLAFNIKTGAWDKGLAQGLGLPSLDVLPEVRDSAGTFGVTRGLGFLPDGIPVSGCLGDQQAALAGQACFGVGEAKCTYGTGAFLLLNLGAEALTSKAGMLTTVAWRLKGQDTFAFEGSAFIAGAAVQFLRDQLKFIDKASAVEAMSSDVVGAPEVYFVPALAGLGAPWWDPVARGSIFGLTRGTSRAQLARATLEGIAFQVQDLLVAMREDFRERISVLRVDGGAAANNLLMRIQADLAGVPVDRPVNIETTVFGAAMFAGLGAGLFTSLDAAASARRTEKLFEPDTSQQTRDRVQLQLAGWKRAVHASKVFAGTC
jgi:glycerol kinase